VLSVKRSRGLSEVPKTVKSSIVEEETGGRRSRGSGARTSEGFREKIKIFVKSRRVISIQTIGSRRVCGRDPCTSEEEPFGENSRREYPKSWESRSNPSHPLG
jgi:hypothetical protein